MNTLRYTITVDNRVITHGSTGRQIAATKPWATHADALSFARRMAITLGGVITEVDDAWSGVSS